MSAKAKKDCPREFDFALIVGNIHELTQDVEDSLFKAGCDDGTLSIQYGLLYIEFSRLASSLEEAIISAIHDVHSAGINAQVRRVDECNLVTAADIARRMGRSRQMVHQYITGKRGPGGFPAPECHLTEGYPLWPWYAVSHWLVQNNLIRPEESMNAEVVDAINDALDRLWETSDYSQRIKKITQELQPQQ